MAEKVLTTSDATFQAFRDATAFAQGRAQAAEQARQNIVAVLPDAQVAAAAKGDALAAAAAKTDALAAKAAKPDAQAAAALLPDLQAARTQTVAAAGLIAWNGGDHTTLPAGAGNYRIMTGPEAGQVWERIAGAGVERRPALEAASATAVSEALQAADTAQNAANALLASLTLTRPQLLSGTADPGAVSRIWDEHGSLNVRNARPGEMPDNGITFKLAGGRMAEREWDGKNVYTAWYGLKPGDDVAGYVPALAAVPEGGVLHWTPGKYMHTLAGYAGKGDKYNPLHVENKHRFIMKMAGVFIEAAPDLPNTTYYGGWMFLGCTHFRIEGWPIYDGRLDVRDPQKFQTDYWHNPDNGGNWEPKPGAPFVYSDPSWANLWMEGWRVERHCIDTYLEVEARRCLMDGILTVGNCVDTYLYRCVSSGNLRQGLSAVGVDGLTIDGGVYELTGKTKGPDGVERGAPPMCGVDLEGEGPGAGGLPEGLPNKRVRIINSPEFRFNRASGIMVHQYTQNAEIQSAHCHRNDAGGLIVDKKAVDTQVGAVLLERNGEMDLATSGSGTVVDGARIISSGSYAIQGDGGERQKLLNTKVSAVGPDGKTNGVVVLDMPDIIVDGLTMEDSIPVGGGYDALHVESLTTGRISNLKMRTKRAGAGNAISLGVNADAGRISGEVIGYAKGIPLPKFGLMLIANRKLSDYSTDIDPVKIVEVLGIEPGAWTLRLHAGPVLDAGNANPTLTLLIGNSKYRGATITASVSKSDGTARYSAFVEGRDIYPQNLSTEFIPLAVALTVRITRAQ